MPGSGGQVPRRQRALHQADVLLRRRLPAARRRADAVRAARIQGAPARRTRLLGLLLQLRAFLAQHGAHRRQGVVPVPQWPARHPRGQPQGLRQRHHARRRGPCRGIRHQQPVDRAQRPDRHAGRQRHVPQRHYAPARAGAAARRWGDRGRARPDPRRRRRSGRGVFYRQLRQGRARQPGGSAQPVVRPLARHAYRLYMDYAAGGR